MPDLFESLHSTDIGYLRIVAGWWDLELSSPDIEIARKELAEYLMDPHRLAEVLDSLPSGVKTAVEGLVASGGKIPWAAFVRQHGEIRDAGPGRRDREQVYLHPISTSETLYYRALLFRAFFNTPSGPQEFAYLPDDFSRVVIEVLKNEIPAGLPGGLPETISSPLGRPALPKERKIPIPVFNYLLDDATTLLAAMRMGIPTPRTSVPGDVLLLFLQIAGIVTGEEPLADEVRSFLETPRQQSLSRLRQAWIDSETFNELHLVPGLACEGEWFNQPNATRTFLLRLLDALPTGKWWSLSSFILAVKEKNPDFQRPSGDYDSWFVKRISDGVFLRGFASWDEVDGALIRYFITGPCYWLGMVELASAEEEGAITAFRTLPDTALLTPDESAKLHVSSQGRVTVPRLVSRAARYQIARFCTWEEKPRVASESGKSMPVLGQAGSMARDLQDEYHYRITTRSLDKALDQGLKINQLLSLLSKNSSVELPPAVVKALKRWELNGTEARVEVQVLLKVSKPEILVELRKSRAGRFLGESLSPVTAVVKKGAQTKVLTALAEMGLLAEGDPQEMAKD